MSKRILIAIGAVVLAFVTGCTSDKGHDGASSAPATSAAGVTISVKGGVLTRTDGRTLYANTVDTAAKITCVGACAATWPPILGPAKAGAGIDASKLGTAKRPDGTKQATYNGHPLYVFSQDAATGDQNGEGIADGAGAWHVATAA